MYLPPQLSKKEVESILEKLVSTLDRLKTKHPDAIIMVGGDFNGKNLDKLVFAFPELTPVKAGATRGGRALDEIYTNVTERVMEKMIQSPLEKDDGTPSDHSVVAASFKLPKQRKSTSIKFEFRPLTTEGVKRFGELLAKTDWDIIKRSDSSSSVEALNELLSKYEEECFPLKSRNIKDTDAPWFNNKNRRLCNRKKRIYKKEGKSERYVLAKAESDAAILESKKVFFNKILEKNSKN